MLGRQFRNWSNTHARNFLPQFTGPSAQYMPLMTVNLERKRALARGERTRRYRARHREACLAYLRKHRLENLEAYRKGHRESRRRNPASILASNRKWQALNAERVLTVRRAYRAVRRAIKRGLLVRPSTCENCGATEVLIEAAHIDYASPLDVRWLCRPCHRRWDKYEPKSLAQGALS